MLKCDGGVFANVQSEIELNYGKAGLHTCTSKCDNDPDCPSTRVLVKILSEYSYYRNELSTLQWKLGLKDGRSLGICRKRTLNTQNYC